MYLLWRHRWLKPLSIERDRLLILDALRDLVAELQLVAIERLPHAYALGYQDDRFTEAGQREVDEKVRRNEGFLTDRLAPSLLHQLTSLDEWFEEGIAALLLAQRYQLVKYTQAYWELVWLGLAERFRGVDPALVRGLVWHLDPKAQHCATCPLKEGTYGSWVEFVANCRGVPGSFEADDECGPGCRCWLEILWAAS